MAGPKSKRSKVPALAPVRGSPVVANVLRATISQLATIGYGALSIEEVAKRAGVNKTTVYRRWPTKAILVRAALGSLGDERVCSPETGSLRTDLLAMGRSMIEFVESAEGRSVMRMMLTEGTEPELAAIAASLRREHEAIPRALFERAVARGELPEGADAILLMGTMVGAIFHKVCLAREPIDSEFLDRLVDLVLYGSMRPTFAAPPRARRRLSPRRAHA